MIRVTVWNEFVHERREQRVAEVYPNGIRAVIADFLGKNEDIEVRTATLDQPENGLPQEVLDSTDVLIWWGHMAHHLVSDEVANRVKERVLAGMGGARQQAFPPADGHPYRKPELARKQRTAALLGGCAGAPNRTGPRRIL